MKITSDFPQGYVFGSNLWNASYDSPIRLDMSELLYLVVYADDVSALVAGHWNTVVALRLEKTEVVYLNYKDNYSSLASRID